MLVKIFLDESAAPLKNNATCLDVPVLNIFKNVPCESKELSGLCHLTSSTSKMTSSGS